MDLPAASGGVVVRAAGAVGSALRSIGVPVGTDVEDPDPLGRPEREAREALDRALKEFAARLAGLGVEMPPEDIQGIAAAPESETLVAMAGASDNVAKLSAKLREAVQRATDNEALVRRYHAIHAAALGVLEVVQQEAADRIAVGILPRLPEFEAEARALKADAESRIAAAASDDEKAVLGKNIEAHDLVLDVIAAYRSRLEGLAAMLSAQAQETGRKRGIAENTARTAALTLDVAGMLRDTERDLAAVLAKRPPVGLQFEAVVLRQEFERLSRRLAEGRT